MMARVITGMLSVGEFARASGLSASSLRFYDTRGILRPDLIDAAGRRWYAPDKIATARLIAAVRATRAPLEIVRAAAAGEDLDGYLLDLENLTADLRRAMHGVSDDGVPADDDSSPSALATSADLAAGLTAVAAAVGSHPLHPATHSVRISVDHVGVELQTTDRHRLMRWRVKARTEGSGALAVSAARRSRSPISSAATSRCACGRAFSFWTTVSRAPCS